MWGGKRVEVMGKWWSRGGRNRQLASKALDEEVRRFLPREWQTGSKDRRSDWRAEKLTQSRREGRRDSWNERKREDTKGPIPEVVATPHAVAAALISGSRKKYGTLFLQNDLESHFGTKFSTEQLLKQAKQAGVEVRTRLVSKRTLDTKADFHKGVVLECASPRIRDTNGSDRCWRLDDISTEKRRRTALVLDQIVDPQNLGAILRTAYFLGIDHVLLSKKRSAQISETVSRVSSGAVEFLLASNRLFTVNGPMTEFLLSLNSLGWRTVATEIPSKATLKPADLKIGPSTVLVLGSEGPGLRGEVLQACTGGSVSITPRSDVNAFADVIDSMNVSAAAAVLIHELTSASR